MVAINTQAEYDMKVTPIPDVFIDEYLPNTENPLFAVIYIFAFRYYSVGLELSVKDTAFKLALSEDEVIEAWNYWQDKGIVKILDDSYENFAFEYLHIESRSQRSKRLSTTGKTSEPKRIEKAEDAKSVTIETSPNYQPQEIEKMQTADVQVKYLFSIAEKMLAKPLKYGEMNTLLSFYDWMGLPIEVIEVMLDYCISNGHKSMRYLEKVAMDWADNEIKTVAEAEQYLAFINKDCRTIMKYLGQSRRDPNPEEMRYFKKWLTELEIPIEIVKEACNKTIFKKGQANIPYTNGILIKWKDQGVHTLEQINALEDEFYKDIEKKSEKSRREPSGTKKASKSRFHNYEAREWDYDKLLELEQIHIDKKLSKKK